MPSHILSFVGFRPIDSDPLPDLTAELLERQKQTALEAAGVTEAEYAAHENDAAWVRSKFGHMLEVGEDR